MDSQTATLEVWKTTIEVQKHFNELGLRVRSLAVTVLGAFFAAAGYALKERSTVDLFGQRLSLTGLILIGAWVCWSAFYVMDRLWYHRLLKAAVQHGRKVEAALKPTVPMVDLTTTIDNLSPLWGMRAGHRLSIFYGFIAVLLWLGAGSALGANSPYYVVGLTLFTVAFGLELSSRSNANKRRGFVRLGAVAAVFYFGWWGLLYWAGSSAVPKYLKLSNDAADQGNWHMSTVWMQSVADAETNVSMAFVWGLALPVLILLVSSLAFWLSRGFRPRS